MMHSQKTLLIHENEPWIKRKGDENFDVPMGCLDGAEVCDLTGLCILSKIKTVLENQNDVRLYRDDGFGILRKLSGPQIERVREEIIKIFEERGLSITTKTNVKVIQFLDIELDLINNTYRPYKKPDDNPMYINVNSNYPPSIIQQIPESINRRLSNLSLNEKVFLNNIQPYREALKRSGFRDELTYVELKISGERNNEKRKRKRKIIWFNPPYSKNVKTNVGKIFFKLLLYKHFPPSHSFHKIFNKKSVEISYSCMRNMSSIISADNRSILNPPKTSFGCNCRTRNMCPLQNKCLTPNIVYQADITNNVDDERRVYLDLSETPFKDKYHNHLRDFNNEIHYKKTELSRYVWDLKRHNKELHITCTIVCKVYSNPKWNFCRLCLKQKLLIIKFSNQDIYFIK